jgi:uncharacterized membrane protein YccC
MMHRRAGAGVLHEIAGTLSLVPETLVSSVRTLIKACSEISFHDPVARVATASMIAVVSAVTIANVMHLDDPWWAAISGYVAMQRTAPASLQRGLLRVVGTIVGATLGIFTLRWVAYDMFACCLVTFAVATISIIGFNVSRYSYAWLLIIVTYGLVALPSLDAPAAAPQIAINRFLEVIIGTGTGVFVAIVLEPSPTMPAPAELGWSGLFGRQLYVTLHAMRWALAVAILPLLWRVFDLTGMSQSAVTLVAVLATPIATDLHDTNRQLVIKGIQRLLGCAIGGLVGLALIGVGIDSLPPWLVSLALPVWLCAYIQNGTHSATYVGAQAGFVLIVTLVQGHGPPTSLEPGIDRLVGIFCGLFVLMLVVLVTSPPSSVRPVVTITT